MAKWVVWKDAEGETHAVPYTTADAAEDSVNGAKSFAFPVEADSAEAAIDKTFAKTLKQAAMIMTQGKACPFCNSSFINLEKGMKLCNMACLLCLAKGPTVPFRGEPVEDFEAAIKVWNKRYENN